MGDPGLEPGCSSSDGFSVRKMLREPITRFIRSAVYANSTYYPYKIKMGGLTAPRHILLLNKILVIDKDAVDASLIKKNYNEKVFIFLSHITRTLILYNPLFL